MFGKLLDYKVEGSKVQLSFEEQNAIIEVIREDIINVLFRLRQKIIVRKQLKVKRQ